MMKKILKWSGRILGLLGILLVVAAAVLSILGTRRLKAVHEIDMEAVVLPEDEIALARGAHLVDVFCAGCHVEDLTGGPVFEDPALGIVDAPNITGAAERFTDEQMVLSIRHGIGSDGRYLVIMPVDSHIYFSKPDLGAMIAFLKTVPQIGELHQAVQLKPIGRMLVGLGVLDVLFPATAINHNQPFPDMPEVEPSLAYGEYLARHCRGCHGPDLAGSTPPNPASPPAPNLTQAGMLATWTEEGFITALRTGITPEGRALQSFMPWKSYAKLDTLELQALWMYLSSLDGQVALGNP